MDRMLYTAMTGARQTMQSQMITPNNLANISTTGFRSDLAAMRSMPLFGNGLPTRVFAMAERAGTEFNAGAIERTGRELDVAIRGEGFLAVQANDGREAYTRVGDLRINTAGLLENSAGHLVMGENGVISIPQAKTITIGADGTISIRPDEGVSNELIVVDRIKLVSPPLTELIKGDDGLFRMKNGQAVPANAEVSLMSGALESSNVNAASELVNMIENARQFEMQTKMMQVADENEQRATKILALG